MKRTLLLALLAMSLAPAKAGAQDIQYDGYPSLVRCHVELRHYQNWARKLGGEDRQNYDWWMGAYCAPEDAGSGYRFVMPW